MRKVNIYIDMDGVLAKWDPSVPEEDTHKLGYFLSRELDENAREMVMRLTREGYNVRILSAAYDAIARIEKSLWLQQYALDEIPAIFVPYRSDKAKYVDEDANVLHVLIDDHTPNLVKWCEHGANFVGAKYMNGINGNGGTWTGARITANHASDDAIKFIETVK